MALGATLELGAVSWPAQKRRPVAFLVVRRSADRFKSDSLGVAFARGASVVLNSSIQVLNQFVGGHLDSESIDHFSPPRGQQQCKHTAMRKQACFSDRCIEAGRI